MKSNPNPYDILKMASENRPVDRSELGIDTPKTCNGLESITEGFNLFQHRRGILNSENKKDKHNRNAQDYAENL